MYPKLTCLLIPIALLATSCSSDVPDDTAPLEGTELSFDVSDLSRSPVTTHIDRFAVYGDIRHRKTGTSTPVVIFDGTMVEYSDGGWRYDDIQYWMPDYEHSFIAVAPAEILETAGSPLYLDSRLSFEYAVPAADGNGAGNGDVEDILIATHRRLHPAGGSGSASVSPVTLTFSHLLSLINVAPAFNDNSKDADEYLLFHKLEISGASTKARFGVLPAQRQSDAPTDDMAVDITEQEKGDYAIVFPSPVKVGNNAKNVSLFADNDAIIMIPQTFAADSEVRMTLYYSMNEDPEINQVSVPLNNQKWVSGRKHLYKFTIEKTAVKFDGCEINPWNVIEGEEITVD